MQLQQYRLPDTNFKVDYVDSFLSEGHSRELYNELILLFPKLSRRVSKTFGDEGLSYTVKFRDASVVRKAQPWLPSLLKVKEKLERHMMDTYQSNINFNVCVVQVYPSGKYGIAPHRDKEMTAGTHICGISIGQSRVLDMAKWKTEPLQSITLSNGSLYVIIPNTNNHYSHSIRKDDSAGTRISLTFRNYVK